MNFQNQLDWMPTMLDDLPVPEQIDLETLQSAIMFECGLLTPLYSEPEIMRRAILQWFRERQWTFEKLIQIIEAEYSPIENTDRYEEYTKNGTDSRTGSETINRTASGSTSSQESSTTSRTQNTTDSVTASSDTEDKVSAYNVDTYSPSSQRTGENTSGGERDETESITVSDTGSGTSSNQSTDSHARQDSGTTEEKLLRHVHGNIGVTSNVQLINEQLSLLHDFNIYQWIAINLRSSLFLEVW